MAKNYADYEQHLLTIPHFKAESVISSGMSFLKFGT